MKKVFYLLMGVVMMSIASCTSCKHDPVEPFNGYDFATVMAADHETMVAKYGSDVRFYEAQAWYKENFDVVDSNYIVKIENVFQYEDTSILVYHFVDSAEIAGLVRFADKLTTWHVYTIDTNDIDYTFTLTVNDFWVEDQSMSLDSVSVSVDSALFILHSIDRIAPNSNFVVMRQPLFPPFPTHPYYIFGTITDCVGVDAKTGEIVDEF